MSRRTRRGRDRSAESSTTTRGIGKAIKSQRGSWLGGTFGSIATGIGTTAGVVSGLATSGPWGLGAAAVGTGILAVTATAGGNVIGRDRTPETIEPSGGSATVDDVVGAVRGVLDKIQDGVANKAIDVKTQIESALRRIMAAVPESSKAEPAAIEQALQSAITEAEEVQRHGTGAIDSAESWARGL